jgi:hypothetical protein
VETKSNPVLEKYSPNLVYFHFQDKLDKTKLTFELNGNLIAALVRAKKSLILTEDEFSVIIYDVDSVERDFSSLIDETLTLVTAPSLRMIPDNGFIYENGARVRAENGFLRVYREGRIKTFSASIMKKSVKRI